MYEEAFNVIKDVAKDTDIERIMGEFMDREDQNYAMFSYINELNGSIDTAKLELEKKCQERDKYQEQNGIEDVFRRRMMKELELKDDKTGKLIDEYNKKYSELRTLLDEIKEPVHRLFVAIGCDPSPMTGMLGYTDAVTDENLMQYLGIIEDRAMETLNTHFFTTEVMKEKIEKDSVPKMVTMREIPTPPSVECVAPDLVDSDFFGSDKMIDHPFNKVKLLMMVRKRLELIMKKKLRLKAKKQTGIRKPNRPDDVLDQVPDHSSIDTFNRSSSDTITRPYDAKSMEEKSQDEKINEETESIMEGRMEGESEIPQLKTTTRQNVAEDPPNNTNDQ